MPMPLSLDARREMWMLVEGIERRETPCFTMAVGTQTANPRLYVYGTIGGWRLDSAEFVKAVHAIDSPAIDLHINSPGGFVDDAVSMFEALEGHPAKVHVKIDGLAASAASVVAMAGDDVEIARAGRMMIHDARTYGYGSPAELEAAAQLGHQVSNTMAAVYAGRAGGKPADWRSRMSATTWYSADQAVKAGLADRITRAAKPRGNPTAQVGNTRGGDPGSRASQLIRARARVALEGVN